MVYRSKQKIKFNEKQEWKVSLSNYFKLCRYGTRIDHNAKIILIKFKFEDVPIQAMLSILMAHNAQKKKLSSLKTFVSILSTLA